ncbi:MAG: ABC transporter permease subunit/CPBP intramembrane protease [Myxococcota bacterium]
MTRIRPDIVLAVTQKDLIDTLRDRRTVLMMVLVPMVSYPALIIAMSEAALIEQEAEKNSPPAVRALSPLPDRIGRALAEDSGLAFTAEPLFPAPPATSTIAHEEARAAILAGADVVVDVATPTIADAYERGTLSVSVWFDETARHGRAYGAKVDRTLKNAAAEIREDRLRSLGIPPAVIRPLSVRRRSISTKNEVGGFVAGTYLPTVILMFIAISCLYPAIDMVAGEKERGTLSTLLTAPVHAVEIVLGKYLAVLTVGALAGLLNVGVLTLTVSQTFAALGDKGSALPHLSALTVFGLLLGVLMVAAIIGALMLTAATFARSFRDANNLLTPVLLVIIMPATLASLPSASLTAGWAAVPIAGLVLWMKAILAGKWSLELTGVVMASSAASAALVLNLATRVFSDERARFSTEGSRADLRSVLFSPPEPTLGTAIGYASVLFVLNYFGALALRGVPMVFAQPILQIGLNLGSTVLLARWLSGRAPGLLRVGLPSPRALLAALLIGAAAWLAVGLPSGWITDALVPGMDRATEALTELFSGKDYPVWMVAGSLAIFPAIGEELVFRGAVLRILGRTLRPRDAILLQALLFALFHTSVFRLLPTFLLGVMFGILAQRSRSLLPSMLAHAVNNGLVIVLSRTGEGWMADLSRPSAIPLIGAVALGIAWFLLPAPSKELAEAPGGNL